MHRQVIWIVILLAALGILRAQEGPVERTKNRLKEEMVRLFHTSVDSLTIDADGAHFRTRHDGRKFMLIDLRVPEQWKNKVVDFQYNFTLSHVGQVFSSPEHHGTITFTVKHITPKGVILEYQSTFDHHSFGKDLSSIDEGEICLEPFRNPKA